MLSLTLSFLSALACAAWLPVLRKSASSLMSNEQTVFTIAVSLLVLLLLLVAPALILTRGFRRGWLNWRKVGALTGLALAACVYLAWDDPVVTRPLTLAKFSPTLPGDEASFQLLMRYAKGSPLAKEFRENKVHAGIRQPRKADDWKVFVQANRTGIEQDHAALAKVEATGRLSTHRRPDALAGRRADPILPARAQLLATYQRVRQSAGAGRPRRCRTR
ncbi:MAG: hypothetical protein EXS39_05095 [Opitutaceae bacterium]|nr:hypothetical protein [Opitutaceae bacterium]